MLPTSSENNFFEAIVIGELQLLRSGEQRLERLYSDLEKKPQLRSRFLRELALLQLRAERLDAALGPMASVKQQPAHIV